MEILWVLSLILTVQPVLRQRATSEPIKVCEPSDGADAGAQIASCIADVPVSGGVVEVTGGGGPQTWGNCPFNSARKPVTVRLAAYSATLKTNCIVPANVSFELTEGTTISLDAPFALIIEGPLTASLSEHFTGTGHIGLHDAKIFGVYPQWWGAKGDGTADDTPAIQAALNSQGKQVLLTQGIFAITTIHLESGVCLCGSGKSATILQSNSGFAVDFHANSGSFDVSVRDLSVKTGAMSSGAIRFGDPDKPMGPFHERMMLSNLALSGPLNSGSSVAGSVGLSLTQMGNSVIENIEVRDYETCYFYDRTTANVTIKPRAEYCRYGMFFRGDAGFAGDILSNETVLNADLLVPNSGNDGYMVRVGKNAMFIHNIAPFYETMPGITTKTMVWLETGSVGYHELDGNYSYTAGSTVTNGLVIEKGTVNHRFTECQGGGQANSPVMISGPGVDVYPKVHFENCFARLLDGWALGGPIAAGYVAVDGDTVVATPGAASLPSHYISEPLVIGDKLLSVGSAPSASAGSQAGSNAPPPIVFIGSTSVRGNVTFGTGENAASGAMVDVIFAVPFPTGNPIITVTPANEASVRLGGQWGIVNSSRRGFTLYISSPPASKQASTTYSFNYQVID